MSGEEFLVRGATLNCSEGSSPSKLNLPACHGVYAGDLPMANMGDQQVGTNIMPFGTCKVKKGPCSPAIGGPWQKPQPKTSINGQKAITMDSFLVCTVGGLIEPQNSGQ